jgi:hypothetical protein
MEQSRRSGVALTVMDGFFAATALAKDLTLVTRNVRDFASFGVPPRNKVRAHVLRDFIRLLMSVNRPQRNRTTGAD